MTVYELCYLFTDEAEIEIYDIEKGETIFAGTSRELDGDVDTLTVQSIDSPLYAENPRVLTINVDTEE